MNVADYVADFLRRVKAGEKPVVRVSKKHAETFLGALKREGVEFAKECLDAIEDPELRRIIKAIFFSTAAGAALGAAVGAAVGAPAAGAAVGAGVGFAAACIALVITARQEDGPDGPSLVLGVQ